MVNIGVAEIEAVKARVELAKKAKARSTKNVEATQAAKEAAKATFEAAAYALEAAKREDEEAAQDLDKAEAAMKDADWKWKVIDVDSEDDQENNGNKKRAASVTEEEDDDDVEPNKRSKRVPGVSIGVDSEDNKDNSGDKKRATSGTEGDEDGVQPNKRSKQDDGVNILDVKSIIVSGCGKNSMNGLYERRELWKGYPSFVHQDNEKFELCRMSWGEWVISESYKVLYCKSDREIDPVKAKWKDSSLSIPPPQLEIHEVDDKSEQNKRDNHDTGISVFDVKSINITGSDRLYVNGLYQRNGMRNGYPLFEHQHDEHLELYRLGSGEWVVSMSHIWGDYYIFSAIADPLKDEWKVSSRGSEPPPKLHVHELI